MSFELSEYQRKIKGYFLTHPHNNMAIEAKAGAGKTSTALMLTDLTKSSDVYIAFNKSIQMEMKAKLRNPKTKCYTMHGLALSVMSYNLDKLHKKYELDNYKVIKIVDKLFEKEYKNSKLHTAEMRDYLETNYLTTYNLVRLKCVPIEVENIEYLVNDMGLFQNENQCIPPVIQEITDWLQLIDEMSIEDFEQECKCDFTDMLYITLKKLQSKEWEIPYWLLFTNIFFDEAQDASRLQYSLLPYFKRTGGRFVFVYDSLQAIYGFAGADCKATQNIMRMFYPIERFKLPINYRCGKNILEYANDQHNAGILPRPNANEGNVIKITEGRIHNYVKPDDFIIGRRNRDLIDIALKLIKKNFKIYLTDKEIVTTIVKFVKSLKKKTVSEVTTFCDDFIKAQAKITDKSEIAKNAEMLEKVRTVKILLDSYTSCSQAVNNFINHIQTIINTEDPTNCIRIMSIHKSKGLEADNVFVLHEGKPFVNLARSKDMLQQEKNLSYVALTRAKENLYLVECSEDFGDNEKNKKEYVSA